MQSAMRLHLRASTRHTYPNQGPISPSRLLSTSSRRQNYASTLPNLRIGSKTRVIIQGFTGRQSTINTQESIAWGTNIVGGVTPGREGTHLDLPVLPTVRRAMDELKPDATGIFVPASAATAAIEEAIEAEVPLIVAVAEHIPMHDMLRVHSMLRTQTKSRLVGPNSPGIISAAEGERCRIGFQPLPCFQSGCVGIAAKSGTLSYEAVASTTRAGLGQSLVIGVGGDVLPGTDLVEALQVLEADPHTKCIALIGEIGGDGEVLAAQWIRDYNHRTPEAERKPIVFMVAGRVNPSTHLGPLGHAGAFWLPGEPNVTQKIEALKTVGATFVNHPAKFGEALKELLEPGTTAAGQAAAAATPDSVEGVKYSSSDDFATAVLDKTSPQQTRGLHTSARSILTRSRPTVSSTSRLMRPRQTRSLHLDRTASQALLYEENRTRRLQWHKYPLRYLALSIDRATRTQCLTTGLISNAKSFSVPMKLNKILMPPGTTDIRKLGQAEWYSIIDTVMNQFNFKINPYLYMRKTLTGALKDTLKDMATIFSEKEAVVVALQLGVNLDDRRPFFVHDSRIELDDAAYRSGGRLEEVHEKYTAMANDPSDKLDRERPDASAISAAKHGIVYRKMHLDGDKSNKFHAHIGTLVNGAGLAMNTIDALGDAGGRATNFLDTGGKATSETILHSFRTILRDRRVRVIFVNIFGGLTQGDMIARGILLAFQSIQNMRIPVVVRIRGTNEREGQRIIAESGLPGVYAFDDFDEAAAKCVELAKAATEQVNSLQKAISEAAHQNMLEGEEVEADEETNVPADQVAAGIPTGEAEAPQEGHIAEEPHAEAQVGEEQSVEKQAGEEKVEEDKSEENGPKENPEDVKI